MLPGAVPLEVCTVSCLVCRFPPAKCLAVTMLHLSGRNSSSLHDKKCALQALPLSFSLTPRLFLCVMCVCRLGCDVWGSGDAGTERAAAQGQPTEICLLVAAQKVKVRVLTVCLILLRDDVYTCM